MSFHNTAFRRLRINVCHDVNRLPVRRIPTSNLDFSCLFGLGNSESLTGSGLCFQLFLLLSFRFVYVSFVLHFTVCNSGQQHTILFIFACSVFIVHCMKNVHYVSSLWISLSLESRAVCLSVMDKWFKAIQCSFLSWTIEKNSFNGV
jgi:hypothetical protein